MLPTHRSDYDLESPFQRTYFANQFGAKSIGEPEWKPHIRNALACPNCEEHSLKGGNGLDWFSSIRCPEVNKPEQNEKLIFSLKGKEWTVTTECIQDVPPKRLSISRPRDPENSKRIYERTLEQRMGRRKKVKDLRNGVTKRAPGDKSYYTVEYEAGFHSHGSTLPVVNFGGTLKTVTDTFIPLVKLPLQPRIPFHLREKRKHKADEINEVKELDLWKPAEPLH